MSPTIINHRWKQYEPFAPGASGNVATEDVVYMLHGLGFATGVDLEKLALTGRWISKRLDRPNMSRAGLALLARIVHEGGPVNG